MIKERMQFRAERQVYRRAIDLHIFVETADPEKIGIVQPVTVNMEDRFSITAPALTLQTEVAQELMDELWRCGLRPTEGTGSAGSLAATERHLEDMRRLAFGSLKIPLVTKP